MKIAELTPRRRELVSLLLKGLTSAEVCDAMAVSNSAFRKLKSLTYKALGIDTDMQLLALAVKEELADSQSLLAVLDLVEDMLP